MPAQGTPHNPPHAPAPVPPQGVGGSGARVGVHRPPLHQPHGPPARNHAPVRRLRRRVERRPARRPPRPRPPAHPQAHAPRPLPRRGGETASGMLAALRRHDDLLRDTGGAGLAPVLAVANPWWATASSCFTSRHKARRAQPQEPRHHLPQHRPPGRGRHHRPARGPRTQGRLRACTCAPPSSW